MFLCCGENCVGKPRFVFILWYMTQAGTEILWGGEGGGMCSFLEIVAMVLVTR